MEKLRFITPNGVCGLTCEWEAEGAKWDAEGWLDEYGPSIGNGRAPLPNGLGWVDLSQFSAVVSC